MKVLLVVISVTVALLLIVVQTACAYGFMVEEDKTSFHFFIFTSVVILLHLASSLHDAFKYIMGK